MAAAVVTLGVVAWYAQYLIQCAFSRGAWGGAGILPLVFLARLAVAGLVVWGVVGLDTPTILRVLLAAFGGSFLLMFGWYFLLIGMDDAIFYLSVSADLLYLIGALIIGSALALTATRSRPRNGHLEA
jgi:hypothetical protein